MVDYALIRLVHRVDAILNNEETARRLREVASCPYMRDRRCVALSKVLSRKGGMNKTEMEILQSFPREGINIGNVSHGLIFGGPLHNSSIAYHKAIVSLIKQGKLVIVEGYRTDLSDRSRMEQIIVKVGD